VLNDNKVVKVLKSEMKRKGIKKESDGLILKG
jgi:hypothetical protein